MKIIVFGGSGFLGSHVADILDDAGHDVMVYDIKASPYLRPSQKMIVGDILDEKLVEKSVSGCDVVYNFAGIVDIDQTNQRPLDSVKYNILGNAVILEAARKAGVKRFVFASSLYVYSKAGAFYRSTKQACELLIENYHEIFKMPYTILRYGSLYGPRASGKNFIRSIIDQALKEKKISRYGDGEEIREYIHVRDAAAGSVEILSDEFANQRVILTGSQAVKIKDFLLMVREMMQNKISIEYLPPKKDSHYELTPYAFAPKTARRLVSRTYIDLHQGILETIYAMHDKSAPVCSDGASGGGRKRKK